MKTLVLRRSLAALSGCLLLAACHHADPDPNPGGCQFIYSYGNGNYFAYFFNAAGQLTTARAPTAFGELHYDYSYANSQVKLPVTYSSNNTWVYWALTLNTQGYVAEATSYYNVGGQIRQQISFGYDTSGHLTGYHLDGYQLGVPTVLSESLRLRLDYQNGDLTQVFDSLKNNLIKVEYSPQANPLKIPFLVENIGLPSINIEPGLLPLLGKPTAHLISGLRVVQPTNPYPYSVAVTYTLDGNGQITKFTTNNGGGPYPYVLTTTCP